MCLYKQVLYIYSMHKYVTCLTFQWFPMTFSLTHFHTQVPHTTSIQTPNTFSLSIYQKYKYPSKAHPDNFHYHSHTTNPFTRPPFDQGKHGLHVYCQRHLYVYRQQVVLTFKSEAFLARFFQTYPGIILVHSTFHSIALTPLITSRKLLKLDVRVISFSLIQPEIMW